MRSKEILQKFFGYTEFKPAQEEIISTILNGESVLTILPTGGGKSLCYQIPALMSPGFSIVISPLIALMKDQVDSINKIETVAAFINSSLDSHEIEKVLQSLANGKIKILYVSPEKISNRYFAERLKSLRPSNLFVDEAHCISEWGHNFRPSYRKIKEFVEFIGLNNVSSFTATATEDVRKDIIDQLGLKNPKVFVRGFERENFHLNVIHTQHKKEKVAELLKGRKEPAIIYTATRKSAEEVSEFLRSNRIDCTYYHAGLAAELRRMIQDDFLSGRVKVIAATNAFGMGIDKSDIRTIFHYNMPGTIENYYQEIGRAGRDGKDASIYLLYDERDKLIQEYFIASSSPSRQQIEDVYQLICNSGKVAVGNIPDKEIPLDKNFLSLLAVKKINHALTNASIKILEESGYIRHRSDFENKHYGQFLLEPNRLNQFAKSFTDAELKDLILLLAREYGSKIFNTKTQIGVDKLSRLLEISEDSIIDLLQTLGRAGIFSYDIPSLFPSVKLITPRIEAKYIQLNLEKARMLTEHAKSKLDKMVRYAFTDQCRFNYILEYFGQFDTNYKCGKCDVCTGSIQASATTLEYLEEIILQTIHESKKPIKKKNLIQILTGKTDLASLKKFTTFNTCTHFRKDEIEISISKLVNSKLIHSINDVLSLTDIGISNFLIPEEEVASNAGVGEYEEELKLFNLLRQIRKEAADKFGQNANLICSDDILREVVRLKPSTHSGLLNVEGFSQRMFNKIGDDFLNVLKIFGDSKNLTDMMKQKKLPENILKVLELVQKKYSLADIASLTKLPESIVSTQIETLIEMQPNLEVDFLFDKNELKEINKIISEGTTDLKLLREAFSNKISYAKLRIAVAKRRVN
ncbi:MAG: RecQ family ATP-dependent DNA helicase [Ignavibacteriales bacterium]|nr:RecQ family ATP-dependent DNA helicase [Ignavibacteriales bacterium]